MPASDYEVECAIGVARLIDERGNYVEDVRQSYGWAITVRGFPAERLQSGEALLLRVGLLKYADGLLIPASSLRVLCQLQDDFVGAFLKQASRLEEQEDENREPSHHRAEIGAAGEE